MFDMFDENNTSNSAYSDSSKTINSVSEERENSFSEGRNNSFVDNNSFSSFGRHGFVISVGGSVFFDEKPFVEKIIDFCKLISELHNEFDLVLVVGGGKIARNYINVGKELGLNNFDLDSIGINITKSNAQLFVLHLKNSFGVMEKISGINNIIHQKKIPVFGGLFEGMTTDAVAALIAEKTGFDFVNLSNVDGIFDSDPKKNSSAFLFKELSFNDMNFLLKDFESKPGQNIFVDLFAANILSRSKITSFFINGNNLENFKDCLIGNSFIGTIVHDSQDFINKDFLVVKKKSKKRVVKKSVKYDASNLSRKKEVVSDIIDPREIDFG